MTAVPVLSRRSVGCISDLTIDRWLLGETPGSDEARRVEEHMKTCAPCASRIGALRGLYATRVPDAGHEPPVKLEREPAQAPGQTGALQVVILRDGLLVGSEFFTPGTYLVGSDPRADLQLDAVLPLHARVYFRDGRVAVKSEQGALFVNGFKVNACELRPIDELLVGPYVLRTRVIRERWSDAPVAAASTLPLSPWGEGQGEGSRTPDATSRMDPIRNALAREPVTALLEVPEHTIIDRPLAAPVAPPKNRVTLELWWGDSRQQAKSFLGAVTARDFPLWGFDVGDDFVLVEPHVSGAFTVRSPEGGAVTTLERGGRTTFSAGAMRLTVSVDALVEALPAAPVVPWPTFLLSAVLLLGFFVAAALAPTPDEDAFVPRELPKLKVTLVAPPPKTKPTPVDVTPDRPSRQRQDAEVRTSERRRAPPPPPRVALDRFSAVNKLLSGSHLKSLLDSNKSPGKPGAGARSGVKNLLAGVGAGAGPKGFTLGVTGDGGPGIGAAGLKHAGGMSGGGYGKGRVGGLVDRPLGTGIRTNGSKTSIDKDAVAKAIADHLQEVSACYERALITNGHAGGRLALEWTITTEGTVAAAKVKSSSLKDGSIASCVVARLKTWRFPKARGGSVVVSYPFVFQSSDF